MLSGSSLKLQDFGPITCSATSDDGGCASLSVVIIQHEPANCFSDARMGISGNVSEGSIVGVPLPVTADGGPNSARVFFEHNEPTGSTGGDAFARSGTVTFTIFEAAPDGGVARAAGSLSVTPAMGGAVIGTFDSANPDCTCSTACP